MYNGTELVHLMISIVTISLAFALPFNINLFPTMLLTVGIAFAVHETAHKAVANAFGCVTVYKAWLWGLGLALAFAIATAGRFIFAAPGAVYIFKDYLTKRENGLISIAGAFSNFLLGLAFLYLIFLPTGSNIGLWGFRINMFIALFNMIPFPPLDGQKVFSWNIMVWGLFFITLIYFNFIFPGALLGF